MSALRVAEVASVLPDDTEVRVAGAGTTTLGELRYSIRLDLRSVGRSNPAHVLQLVGRAWDLPPSVLVSRRRTPEVLLPRQVAMYVMHESLGMSKSAIGREFSKDHSTVCYSIDRARALVARDSVLRENVARICGDVATVQIYRGRADEG